MKRNRFKRLIAMFICLSIVISTCPVTYGASIPGKYSPYVTNGRVDYKLLHSYYFTSLTGNDELGPPTSRFTITVKRGTKVIATKTSDTAGVLYAQVGDTITFSNTSEPSEGNALSKCDFQVSNGTTIKQTTSLGQMNQIFNDTVKTNVAGAYNIYLNVMDNSTLNTEGWGNWGFNGTHVSPGTNPGGGTGSDFPGWWYYSKLTVEIRSPEFTLQEKHIATDSGTVLGATNHEGITSSTLTTSAKSFTGYDFIGSRAGYTWEDIADGDTKSISSNTANFDATHPNAFHYYYYRKSITGPPPPGTADIVVYYKDKVTGEAVAPPDETTYKGKSYGTYSIPAAVVTGYTLDASTPSPKSVTVDAVNNSVKVTFLYNSQGGSTPGNKPPVAIITGSNTIFAGEEVTLSGTGSYDPDGEIVAYTWDIGTGTLVYNNGSRIRLWYEEPGSKTPELTVTDDDGATDWTEHNIRVKEPVPTVNLVVSGKLKENRKVTLDASDTYSPKHYPINYFNWAINNSTDLKLLAPLNTAMKHDVLFKTTRSYTPVIIVKNTYGLSGSDTETFVIAPDQNPKANFSAVVKLLRNPADVAKNATITATNLCSSPDNDPIKATVMFYAYDSDNDGSFDDETWYYSLSGTTWLAAGLTYAQLKAGSFDIYTRGTGNPATFTVKTNQVGKYKFEAMTIENIPAADTIPSLITPADYKRNSTFTSKPDSEKIIEIINTAPTITFEAKKKKEVDVLIATDYTGQKLANLQAALNMQKAALLAKDIDVKCTIVNTTNPVAHINDAKFWYRRYGRYGYHADKESWSSGGGGNDHYDEPYEDTVLWEEQQVLESEVGYLPPRIPRNVTWSKSGIIFEEDEDGVKNWEREYYNVTIRAQNDIKSQDIIKKVVYQRSGMASDTSYGYQYSNIHSEGVSLDSSFIKEEKVADVTLNINSIDFASVTSAALRANSDRCLLFIGDSSSKIYSGEWGNHFPFGGLTKAEQDYIKANGIKPYIVTPEATLDTVVGIEKAKELYVGTMPYFRIQDRTYWTILDNYPAMSSLAGEIQEIHGDYILFTNGTLQYRAGGASFATLATGVTKLIKEKDQSNAQNNVSDLWVVTTDGKLRQFKSGVPGYVLSYPNAVDVFSTSQIARGEGTYIISCTDSSIFLYKNGTTKALYGSGLYACLSRDVYDMYDDFSEYACLLVYNDGYMQVGLLHDESYWDSASSSYKYRLKEIIPKSLYLQNYNTTTNTLTSYGGFPRVTPISASNFMYKNKLFTYERIYIDWNFSTYRYYIAYNDFETTGNITSYKDGITTYIDGSVKVPFTSYYYYEVNERERSGYRTLYFISPELQEKTIAKVYAGECYTIVLTTDNHLYKWIDRTNYGKTVPTSGTLTLLTDNAGDFTIGTPYYNGVAGYYHDKNNNTIKSMANNSILINKVVDAKSMNNNKTIYSITQDGALCKDGSSTNLIKTKLVIDDPTKQYITLRGILDDIPDTKYFAAGQYAAAVQDITNSYLNDTSYTTNYILVNDEVSYTTAYSDYENDNKYAEEWKLLHEPYWFDNSMGLAPFNGQTLASPVTKYTKKGRYTINLRARDNPKNDIRFRNDNNEAYNYYKWSTGNQNVLLYVHERPIALARAAITKNSNDTYTVKALDAGSYDPDHSNSRADKGIAAREWRWKKAASTVWTAGQMDKTDCTADESYVIQLRVKDIEGVWSDYYTITIDRDNPPVALFSLDKTLINISDPLRVRDQSFPQSFSTITNWHWVVKKLNTDGTVPGTNLQSAIFTASNVGTETLAGFDANVKTNYAANGVGSYRVYLRVKDSNGLWSDGGTNSTTPADLSKYYSMDFNVDKAPTASFTVAKSVIRTDELLKVKDTTTSAGTSEIAKWHWIVKKLNADGTIPAVYIQNKIFTNSNTGTDTLAGYDCNVEHDYRTHGAGIYRIYLRACNGNGMWSDGGTDAAFNLGGFFYRDVVVDAPPTASFSIETNPIEPSEVLKLRDTSAVVGVSPLDRWHWIIKKLNPDGSEPAVDLLNSEYPTHNEGTGILKGFESNIITDYSKLGPGTYRIYLRVRNANGMWSDGFFQRDLIVRESFKICNFRVVKVRDLHLEDFYYNPATGQYDDRPMDVNSMAVDRYNFNRMVEGLTKGYSFEFEIDTVNFNGSSDEIIINPHFYTCDSSGRDAEERDLYWENSDHEILKAGQGGHASWAEIRLGRASRIIKDGSKATWRGSYLIPGTAWAVPKYTAKENAVSKKLKKDIIVSFEIKGYKDGAMKFDYNLRQWPLERDHIKGHYEIGDVIRYDHTKCNLDDNKVILNRP